MIAAAIRNPLITLAIAASLVIAGFWAWRSVPVDAIPDLSDNQVIVWAEWPGKSPEDVDLQITSRLARELQGLPGVKTVRGMSLYGGSYVYVIFDEKRDLYECRTRTLERLSQVQALMPAGVQARLGPDATAMGQVFAFSLQGQRDTESKRYVLDQVVVPALKGVPGVAEVAPVGGVVREYQIDIDPTRLEEQGITIDMLMMAVQSAGRDVGAMSVEKTGIETMIRGLGFVRNVKDVEDIVIRGNAARSAGLKLKDIATVHLGGAVRQGILADGNQEQVGAIVAMRVKEDPKSVINAVKMRLADLAPTLAKESLTAIPYYDRSQLILETNQTLAHTLIEELIVTVLVIVVFLLHARASLTVAISLPLGVLTTFLAMHLLGVSANIMSLAGIAIAIGVMVDFGIVMTENITQHLVELQERRHKAGLEPPRNPFDPEVTEAVIAGAKEVSRALMTAAATTIIGFLPIFVLTDQAGRLFIPLAVTKTLAIGGAVMFGMLLVPLLCRLLLPPWQVRKIIILGLAGLVGGVTFGWFIVGGITLHFDHDRWFITIPGFIVGPLLGALAAYVVWRLGRERLVSYEENPVSHGIHVAYDWAYTRIQRHRLVFTGAILVVASTGWLLGVGWQSLSWPLRQGIHLAGGDLSATAVDKALTRAFPGIGASFLPPLDEGSLLYMPSIPATGGLGETLRVLKTQNQLIGTIPEVAQIMGKMGRAETALDPAPIGMIETVVILKPYAEWPLHEITRSDGTIEHRPRTLAEVRQALSAISDIPGVAPSWLQPIETRVVMLSTGIKSKIALQVLGDDAEGLERFAEQAEKVVQMVPGAADVQMQREGGKPYAEIRLDRERMARFGITAEQVMQTVETTLGGMPVTFSVEGTQRYGVRLRYLRERRDDFDEMSLMQVPIGSGKHGAIALQSLVAVPVVHTIALEDGLAAKDWLPGQTLTVQRNTVVLAPDRIEVTLPAGDDPLRTTATPHHGNLNVLSSQPSVTALTYTIGPMAIRSEGGKRTQYVLLNARGRAEVDVVREADSKVRAAIAAGQVSLPKGATFRWVGSYEQKLKADATMTWVIAAAMGVMLVLIYLGTRSLLTTSIIISCNVTVTTAGGFIAVWLAGVEMTTAVIVGFLVLLGVMFNDGILLGTYLHEQFKIPPRNLEEMHQRIFTAGLRRRRPALMTNLTTLLSLVPILWSEGRGAEVMRPMVLPVIGGMIADLISLFSVPVFYAWWWEAKLKREAKNVASTAPVPPDAPPPAPATM
ncbi:MAG: efflux RND transporter permease subunit [Caulobacterales bacterium]|nr:efflux RND transporter permease subunit [Caulobacterales bacterium]